VWFAIGVGRSLWAGVWWYAIRAVDLHLMLVSATSVLAMVLQYSAAAYLFAQPTRDDAACNNNVRAAPDLSVWLLAQYLTIAEVHDRWAGVQWSWPVVAYRVVIGVGAPLTLVLTANTTWAWAAEGVAFGVATALIAVAVLLTVVEPRAPAVATYVAHAGIRVRTVPPAQSVDTFLV
jgi:hypothetical protein